ncbi:polyhomeotic-like protein 3 isoform X2 [Scleropages formosus]|uniref:Polyhomeotic homolog 3 n=1 Tax=Scleropages formosus TaxID=113540 RepID=A0A8C9VGN5_SCLFO|nr:polyhomeotic-like protein 3 isoform X2 [Scleropages formosus]
MKKLRRAEESLLEAELQRECCYRCESLAVCVCAQQPNKPQSCRCWGWEGLKSCGFRRDRAQWNVSHSVFLCFLLFSFLNALVQVPQVEGHRCPTVCCPAVSCRSVLFSPLLFFPADPRLVFSYDLPCVPSLSRVSPCPFNQILLPPPPVVTQRGGHAKHSSSATAVGPISRSALLLGNSSLTSQAQVYLHAKMVQTLALRTPQGLPLRRTHPSHPLTLPHATMFAQQPEGPPKAGKMGERPGGESHDTAVTRMQSAHQLPIAPAPTLYSSVQSHGLIKHMLQCKSIHKGGHNPLIIPRPVRIHRPKVSLQAAAQKTLPTTQVCLTSGEPVHPASPTITTPSSVQSQQSALTTSSAALFSMSQPSQTEAIMELHMKTMRSPTDMSPTTVVTPSTAPIQWQLPTLKAAPLGSAQLSPHCSAKKAPPPLLPHRPQESSPSKPIDSPSTPQVSQATVTTTLLAPPSSPPLAPPSSQPAPSPSSTLKALQLLRALVQESEMLPRKRMLESKDQEDEIHPPAKVKSPSPRPSSPPASAVDLSETQESQEVYVSVGMHTEEQLEERQPDPPTKAGDSTTASPPPTSGPEGPCKDTFSLLASCTGSASSRSPPPPPSWPPDASSLPHVTPDDSSSITESPRDAPFSDSLQPQLQVQDALIRCRNQSPTASHPGVSGRESSQAIVRPQILTHLVEGFVIQEGLEPFPVGRSSLMVEHQSEEALPNGTANPSVELDRSEVSDSDDMVAEDSLEEDVLCEFCGKRGSAHTFLRSQRFCSLQCARGFNVAYSKRITGLKASKMSRWAQRAEQKRGQMPSTAEMNQADRFLRQRASARYSSTGTLSSDSKQFPKGEEGNEPPVPMKTRLRRQTEQDQQLRDRAKAVSSWTPKSALPPPPNPSLWTVDQVWAFIHAMPGCQSIAEEFRLQEIDGQALLLLTEDHLVGAMKLKLGPALKIHARISALKAP